MRWPDARLRAMVLALALLAGPATAADAPATPALSASAVMQAASAVEADPQLGGFEKGRTLKFKTRGSQPKDDDVNWWINLFKSLSFGLRLVVWLVVAALFILALLRLRDWLKRSGPAAVQAPDAPTHIGSLDIRPESLPDDIGRAARHLLEQGALRPALSLLYRGALSRLERKVFFLLCWVNGLTDSARGGEDDRADEGVFEILRGRLEHELRAKKEAEEVAATRAAVVHTSQKLVAEVVQQ